MKKPLNIAINLLYMNRRLSGGSITYGINLVNELVKLDKSNNYTIYINKDCTDLPLVLADNYTTKLIPFKNKYVYVRYFWEQLIFPFILFFKKFDLVHSPGYVGPVFCPSVHIISILDMNYKRHGESMSKSKRILLGAMVKLMSIFAKHIITISNFSKEEICKELKVRKDKVTVTHLSGSSDNIKSNVKIDLENLYNINSDYIIAFGSTSSHKNILGLIEAFDIVSKKIKDIKLVLVGFQHNNKELNDLILKLDLLNKVSFTGFVPDEHILPLLVGSKLFVFPSFYEGFGIPLLDAQAAGVPVASSTAASLPEVGNLAATYFDPYNIKEMADVMKDILSNKELSIDLIKKGLENRSKFSWHKTAIETLKCYELVII
ncbi:MAG: glycosyltransferase family 1 protein [Pelobium sp.]